MKITQITNEHLLNRIKYFERKLNNAPLYQFYMGDSEFAEDAVDQENRYNEELFESIKNHIIYMKKIAKQRGIYSNVN